MGSSIVANNLHLQIEYSIIPFNNGNLPAFALFGFDIFGFLRKKPQDSNVLSQISSLQSLHSLATDAQEPSVGTAEEEMIDLTRVIAQKIGQKEIVAVGSHFISQDGIEAFVRHTTELPNTTIQKGEVDLENLLDIPKTVVDIVTE